MNFKPTAEIEASFRRVERKLDAMLEESRACLVGERITLRDDSNRSGFDKCGFPSFVWEYHFERREAYGSEIKAAAANLRYVEPIEEEEAQEINLDTVAEIFQIGKQSRIKEKRERIYSIERFLNVRLDQVVMNSIADAEQALSAR